MSDRLKEFQRQRALLQEHLAWLDREIAREGANQPPPPSVSAATPGAPTPPSPEVAGVGSDAAGEKAGAMASDAKRGCLIAFATGMVVFFGLVAVAYLLYLRWR